MNAILLGLYAVLFGVLGLLLGTAGAFIALLLPGLRDRVGGYFERASATTLYRPSITFGEGNDLLYKRRGYDADQGAEVIGSGDGQLEIANPDDSIWSFHGTPLAIVDEFFGVAIDQTHLIPSEEYEHHQRENTLWVGDIMEWTNRAGKLAAPAFAAVPKAGVPGKLESVRRLFGRGEEADHPDTTTELFAKAQQGHNETAMWKQALVPLGAFVLTFLLWWFGAKYGPGGGSSQSPRTVGSSLLLLLGLPSTSSLADAVRDRINAIRARLQTDGDDDSQQVEKEDGGRGLAARLASAAPSPRTVGFGILAAIAVLATLVLLYVLFLFFGPLGLAIVLFTFGIGFAIFPFSGPLLNKRLPTAIAERLAGLYLRMGLLPYDNPNLELTTDGHRFVDGDGDGPRYRLAGQHVGLTINDEDIRDLYGNRAETATEVEIRASEGKPEVTGIPQGYVETDTLTYDRVKAFIPKDPSSDYLYARLDRIMQPFLNANIGNRSRKALEKAKEEYGGGRAPMDMRQILWASFGGMVFGSVIGYLMFFGL